MLDSFTREFGAAGPLCLAEAPGRVNLIGEHTDYNGLAVFPMAIQRRIRIVFQPRTDALVRLASGDGYGRREFTIADEIAPYDAGDWGNYGKAAARALARRYGTLMGIDGVVSGDIPAAAGLSSSSALVVAAAQALLAANRREATFAEWIEILPEGEQYVGTRGGAMDHAVCLAGEEGKALKIDFTPLAVEPIPVPAGWSFLVGHSLVRAEKSGEARESYNARRESCRKALEWFGASASYPGLMRETPVADLLRQAGAMPELERRRFRHVVTEAVRVEQARAAMLGADMQRFGALMQESHKSLRDDFEVSHPEVDRLVEAFLDAGAAGARVTGAGFGGCVVALCGAGESGAVRQKVEYRYYAERPQRAGFGEYLLEARPAAGARVREL